MKSGGTSSCKGRVIDLLIISKENKTQGKSQGNSKQAVFLGPCEEVILLLGKDHNSALKLQEDSTDPSLVLPLLACDNKHVL